MAAVSIASLVTASCATVGLPTAVPSPTSAELEAQGPTATQKQRVKPLKAPPGIIASVSDRGLFVSWIGVEGATDGYQVGIDDAWYAVPGTKVRFTSVFPGLKYHIQVAAVANGVRGPAVTTTVKKGEGKPPREIIKGRPKPTPSLVTPSTSPTPVTSESPSSAGGSISPSTSPTPSEDPATDPSPPAADRDIVSTKVNGCGFDADGLVDLRITVRLAPGDGRAPVALLDTLGRRYDPDPEAGATNKMVFVPVAKKEPPAGAAVSIARYSEDGEETPDDVELTPLEWGYQLCDQPIENPRWE